MFLSPVNSMMTIILSMSIIMILSSNSILSMWVALEINTISFISIMFLQKTQESAESCIKYFLPQALASSIFIFSFIISPFFPNNTITNVMTFLSMILKLGMAPLHQWFPIVAMKTTWSSNLLLMTIQKIPPFTIIMNIPSSPPTFTLIIMASAIVGPLGGLNQTNLKSLIAFSSITHMAWMLVSINISFSLWLIYLAFYSLLILSLIMIMKPKLITINQTMHLSQNLTTKILVVLLLLSLGGLPPLTGFFPKWLVISLLQNPLLILTLVSSALLNLFFYLRLLYPFLLISSDHPKWTHPPNTLKGSFPLWTSLFALPISMLSFFLIL